MTDRRAIFSTHFLDDLDYWVRTNRKTARRLLKIVRETLREPHRGIGNPEALRGTLTGLWSRRLTQEHRVVYEVTGDAVSFLQGRYHY